MKLINIKKTYYNKTNVVEALKGINLEFDENGITMILGSSGCGKTTLLNIMSGKDKDFDGRIEDIPNADYLTQEFNLFEEMSVLENLIIVKNDLEVIHQYLTLFQMEGHINKKVKYLSNGQKRRVQFIRALLHKPGLLLCDEPTAALDHENAQMLMEELKKLSDDIQIILVTHDIALAEKYGDRIIRMNQGCVVSDEKINQHKKYEIGEKIEKKTLKDTFKFVLVEIKSRFSDSITTILLSTLCIVMLFSVFTFYSDVMKQYDYNETFKRSDNLILSLPKSVKRINLSSSKIDFRHEFEYYYSINEGIKAEDVEKVIEENPEIMAIESYWSKQYDLAGSQPSMSKTQTLFKTFKYQGDEEIFDFVNYPFYQPMYVYSDEFLIRESKISQENSLYAGKLDDPSGLGLQEHFYSNNILSCYDLVNGATLPMLVGKMCQGENEIVISKNLADKIMKNEGYASIEEIVGNNILIGLYGHKNYYAFDDLVLEEDENGDYQPMKLNIVDLIELKVTGISTIENDYSLMLFFNNGYANNATINYFINDREYLYFHYTRFLVEPGRNTEAIAKKINKSFDMDDKSFVKFEGRGLEEVKKYYKNPNNFSIYFLSMTLVFMLLFIVHYLFKRKRMKKENEIIERYGYKIGCERMIRISILAGISIVLAFFAAHSFCDYMNQFAKSYSYEMLMNFSPLRIVLMGVCLMIYEILIEMILFRKSR